MTFHVITPFTRTQNIPILVSLLRPLGIIWHPLPSVETKFPDEPWIQPMITTYPESWEATGGAPYFKVNTFIEAGLIDEDYYSALCDDDCFEQSFFNKIRQRNADVIIASMFCTRHGILSALPDNMHPSRVSFQQSIAKGKVLHGYRYANSCQADGQLIERIVTENRVQYASDAFVLANVLMG